VHVYKFLVFFHKKEKVELGNNTKHVQQFLDAFRKEMQKPHVHYKLCRNKWIDFILIWYGSTTLKFVYSWGIKRPGREAHHSPSCSAEVVWYVVRYRSNFALAADR
jgi:hypothetical protein